MSDQENARKATDIILDLESKIDKLLSVVYSQDLTIKTISNKLNMLIELNKQASNTKPVANAITITAVQSPIKSQQPIPMEVAPVGVRKTSRPEPASNGLDKYPVQLPSMREKAEAVVNTAKVKKQQPKEEIFIEKQSDNQFITKDQVVQKIPIIQRILDKNGKSVFMADVEVYDNIGNTIFKGRTNGSGKWMTSLPIGSYNAKISKRENLTKEKLTISVDFAVDEQEKIELKTTMLK